MKEDLITGQRSVIVSMVSAILANGAAGLLYVWSLFIQPIEGALALNRADLGLISSLSLVSVTLGVAVMPLVIVRIGRLPLVVLVFVLIAGGHLAFGIWSTRWVLTIGYGVGFGAGSGMAYGLALSLAASLPARIRAPGIGLALGAFALSGIMLPMLLGNWIAETDPGAAFYRIGIVTAIVGGLCAAVLAAGHDTKSAATAEPVAAVPIDRPFLILSIVFFLLCFIGLAVMSQATAIAADTRTNTAAFATTALTLGYLGGSLVGAPLAGVMGERFMLFALGGFALIGTVLMYLAGPVILFAGAALIGATFGGSGSIMPVLLGLRYGAANISRTYGRMMFAYGLAGLIAPGVAGLLYENAQSYAPTLILCAVLALLAIASVPILNRTGTSK